MPAAFQHPPAQRDEAGAGDCFSGACVVSGLHPYTSPRYLSSGMSGNEGQDALPGIGGFVGEFFVAAVEEAVRRAGIDDDFVFDTRFVQVFIELVYLLHGNALVGSAIEAEERIFFVYGLVKHSAVRTGQLARQACVKTDDSGEAKVLSAGIQGKRTTHAETNHKGFTLRALA